MRRLARWRARAARGITAGALTAVALLVPLSAGAQVQDPTLTINGLIDTVTTAGRNLFDPNFGSSSDSLWYARERGRFRLTYEVEPLGLKAVLELQLDLVWGQVGGSDPDGGVGLGLAGFGKVGVLDLDTDVTGVEKVRNLFLEFSAPPVSWLPHTTVRLGAQPFDVTFKRGVLATSDFAGLWLRSEITDNVSLALAAGQMGATAVDPRASADGGDDFFALMTATADVPVDQWGIRFTLRPLLGYLQAEGGTSPTVRCRIDCAGLPSAGLGPRVNPITGVVIPATPGSYGPESTERRVYWGLDAKIERGRDRWGFLSFDPTIIFMWSEADVFGDAGTCSGPSGCPDSPKTTNRVRSWLVDLRASWFCDVRCLDETAVGRVVRVGEGVRVEGLFAWTPGDASHHDLFRKNRAYHPIATRNEYLTGWGEILALGSADNVVGVAHGLGENIGLGRYGRIQVGTRVTYDILRYGDEALSVQFRWSSLWTDQKVDTDAGPSAAAVAAGTGQLQGSYGNVPCALVDGTCLAGNNRRGDARYIGTEISLEFSYQLMRGLVLNVAGAYLFAGGALDSTFPDEGGTLRKHTARDAQLIAMRVRYTF